MMKNDLKNAVRFAGILMIGVFISGCASGKDSNVIRIGSKDFTENMVISEIYALALRDAGYDVETVPGIASSVIHTSIVNDEIDIYPEYTGTGLLSILKLPMETDADLVYETVKNAYYSEFGITWLEYAPANDSQGLVIRTDVSEELGIDTISDLQKNAQVLRFASQGEFDEREDGIAGLEKVYGEFNWKSSTVYENSLKYQVLRSDEADVAPAYTTEGQLVNTSEYRILEDDKNFWPPYNVAPIVRNEVLEKNPEIEDVLNRISGKLTTEAVISLNASVDVDGREYEEVAGEFYESIK